jgi:enoyl-CoA hydratase/carnithine racemase
MADGTTTTSPVLLRERSTRNGLRIGHATLNAEKSINALTLDMVRVLDRALVRWAADPGIVCVVLDGAGEKGFCAGGDVRYLRDAALAHRGPGPNAKAEAFFAEEYRLDHRIHTYAKPILVWGTGIVMGGGLGLFAGASHRVVTETSRFAMPEVGIGLFPDVGGSWFLPRMPGGAGLFLALTGAPMNAADALHVGLADAMVAAVDRPGVLDRLDSIGFTGRREEDHDTLSTVLAAFASGARALRPVSQLQAHAEIIAQLTAGSSLATVRAAITAYAGDDPWLQRAARSLSSGSPTSAALVWELFRRARHLGLADVFRQELIVALQCCAHPDFPEGVRALLIDKDQRPNWTPATPGAVDADWIEAHFTPPWSALANEADPLADLT